MKREELSLWWAGEADSIFVFYLTGAMALSFFVTVMITRSLRRTEPRVTELIHEDSLKHMLVTYLLSISTSRKRGTSCPDTVKVFMQLSGENGQSQFFQLKSQKGGKPMFQRGFLDIFLFKVPVSLGKIKGVKLVLSGVDKSLSWKITSVQLYDPASKRLKDLQTSVMATEIIGFGDATQRVLALQRPCVQWFLSVCLYHQWLAGFINSFYFGAFTETLHVILMFATLFTLLFFTQMTYIILPGGTDDDMFDIEIPSLLMGSLIPAAVWTTLFFIFEVLIRKTRSYEKNPGNAYFTVIKESICAKKMACYQKRENCDDEGKSNIWTTFVTKEEDLNDYTAIEIDSDSSNVPLYLTRLITLIELEEERLRGMVKDREELLQQKKSLLNYSKETNFSRMSFVSCVQSAASIFQCEINLPSFSQVFVDRILSGKSLVKLVTEPDSGAAGQLGYRTNSYLDIIRGKQEKSHIRLDSKNSTDPVTLEMTGNGFDFLAKASSGQIEIADTDETNKNIPILGNTHETQDDSSRTKGSNQDQPHSVPKLVIELESERLARNQPSQEHIIDIEDIKVEDSTALLDTKIDIADTETAAGVRRRHLEKPSVESVDKIRGSSVMFEQGHTDEENSPLETVNTISDMAMPEVQYSQHTMKKSTLKLLWQEWQASQRKWCRSMIRAVHEAFKCCRHDLLHGTIRTPELDIVLLEWSQEVVKRITASCTLRRFTFEEDMLEQDHLIRLFSHLSSEILMFAVRDVYQCLKTSECMALADVILQAHHVMIAVEQAADCIIYLINTDSQTMCEGFRYLDMGQDLVDIRDQFLQMSFHLTVMHSDVTWAYFVMLLRDQERAGLLLDSTLERLSEYVKTQLASENMENVIIKKLCHAAENEAKQEVWQEYCSQEELFTSILIKQQVVKKLGQMIKENVRKKKIFDVKYDLLPIKPKTRLEKLVEKRRLVVDKVSSKKKNPDVQRVLSSEINRHELKIVSEALGRFIESLKCLREKLHKKWKREGMKSSVPGGKYLAQVLLHPHVHVEDRQEGQYKFKNYLHLKRTETFLQQYLESVVLEMVGMVLYVVVDDNRLRTANLEDNDKDQALADVLANLDTLGIVLSQDLHSMAHSIISQEASLTSLDMEMVKKSSQQLMRKSSILGNRNFSAIPVPADEQMDLTNKTTEDGGESTTEGRQDNIPDPELDLAPQNIETASQKVKTDNSMNWENISDNDVAKLSMKSEGELHVDDDNGDAKTDGSTEEISLSDLIKELQPLKLYMQFLQTRESLRGQSTLVGHIDRQKEKRDYAYSVYINNMVDSYYLIQEGDDSHMFTKAGRYQLEYDLMGESSKPLPKCVKTFVLCLILLLILFSGIYVTVIGGQFSTIQVQEWVCFYLLSVALFGFVFEPIRAIVLGHILQRA